MPTQNKEIKMSYKNITDKQKLDIIDRKILKIYNIISVVNDAMEYRQDETAHITDCLELLRILEYEVKNINKLF